MVMTRFDRLRMISMMTGLMVPLVMLVTLMMKMKMTMIILMIARLGDHACVHQSYVMIAT